MKNWEQGNDIGFTWVDKARQEVLERWCLFCWKQWPIWICWECEKLEISKTTKDAFDNII